jgi:hypothetical protein
MIQSTTEGLDVFQSPAADTLTGVSHLNFCAVLVHGFQSRHWTDHAAGTPKMLRQDSVLRLQMRWKP